MRQRCNERAGFSLFEALLSLAVLGLVAMVLTSGRLAPSQGLQQRAEIAAVRQEASQFRLRAMRSGAAVPWENPMLCAVAEPVVFFADGSATGGPICIKEVVLVVQTLSGALEEAR